jgi:ubiquinone/menaquinone biosynthesis C-methylase UbiE
MVDTDYNKINQETYDSISSHWDTKRQNQWPKIVEFFDSLTITPDTKMIDIGCGTGRVLELAKQKGVTNPIGSDFSSGQLEIVKQKGFDTVESDMRTIPKNDGAFDIIVNIAALHHLLATNEQLEAIKQMKRLLSKNGEMLVSIWMPQNDFLDKQLEKGKFKFIKDKTVKVTYTSPDGVYERFYYLFEQDEIVNMFEQCGLNCKKVELFNGNLYITANHK